MKIELAGGIEVMVWN